MIPRLISSVFDSHVRQKGLNYYNSRRITQFIIKNNGIIANVKGSELYTVNLKLEDEDLTVSCECPYYYSFGYCKHLWAVILECETRFIFSAKNWNNISTIALYRDNNDFDQEDEPFIDTNTFHRATAKKSHDAPWKSIFSCVHIPSKPAVSKKKELLFYYINPDSVDRSGFPIELTTRFRKVDGQWSRPQYTQISAYNKDKFDDKTDLAIISLLLGTSSFYNSINTFAPLSKAQVDVLLPLMASTGRLYFKANDGTEHGPLQFDTTMHAFRASMNKATNNNYELTCDLYKNDELIDNKLILFCWGGGLVVTPDKVAKLDCGDTLNAMMHIASQGCIPIDADTIPDFLHDYYNSPVRLPITFSDDLKLQEKIITPIPCLRLLQKDFSEQFKHLVAEVYFDYDGLEIHPNDIQNALYDKNNGNALVIDKQFHANALSYLEESGVSFFSTYYRERPVAKITQKQLPSLVNTLINKGWRVEGEKGVFKKSGAISIAVTSGVDWFDVDVSCKYDGTDVPLPKLLAAIKNKEQYVMLDDGSLGLLPEEWLRKYSSFARMGDIHDDSIRFKRSQTLLIDMLLADQESNCTGDEVFTRIRKELNDFDGITPEEPHRTFKGSLRPYQKEGLGWFTFLEKFGFGGCLADDMGLGKTVQVLSYLHKRKVTQTKRKKLSSSEYKTSLVVVPRSLIFNWIQEAKKFTHSLKVLDFSGADRKDNSLDFSDYDIVLITYGTLRRDIVKLKEFGFDYVILDEAQVIKNASTITAKSARLLKGRNRLALSGTPVENHLGDLWSIFEFLNPGILGSASVFAFAQNAASQPDDQTCTLLRRVLKPFILRRSKSQVASDLPPRTEEVILCEMEPAQAKIYEELKNYYQINLLSKVEKDGINKSKIMILEALLRLRQAACHPGLIDSKKSVVTSVKLETLHSQIEELREEGHKCIVFSQFTTMLSIIKKRLDSAGITYEYLDGQTIDRQSRVDRFQNDPLCQVFLISLKAGGVGLNLTAAEYVFIFDPWWNPAAEAQAIDRTHRIGQNRPVFAYRLICKGTVEEKVLALQNSKRQLAESIISADDSIIRSISTEDLKLLLG